MRGKDRVAEVAAQQLADPRGELNEERLVEPQLGADLRDILGGGEIAGDDRRRIARGQMQEREDEDRDDDDHRHGRQQAADQEDVHDVRSHSTRFSQHRPRSFIHAAYPNDTLCQINPKCRTLHLGHLGSSVQVSHL